MTGVAVTDFLGPKLRMKSLKKLSLKLNKMVKPFLKWVGGKTQILDKLMDKAPKCIPGDYHEPFVGGGSVLFKMLETVEINGTVYASDVNPHLIKLYKAIQQDPETLIKETQELSSETSELKYYEVRADFIDDPTPAQFLYLNKTCFRGLYREGPRGFNVPWGHYEDPKIIDPAHIRLVSKLIQRVVFRTQSFEESLKGPFRPEDFVYLDPPYMNTFAGYTRRGFSLKDHELLFRIVKTLVPHFMLSNSNCEEVQKYFEGFPQCTLECRRAINSRNPGAIASELLITSC